MRIRYSTEAHNDLVDTIFYGNENFGSAQSNKYVAQIRNAIELIGLSPEMARLRTELERPVRIHTVGAHHVQCWQEAYAGLLPDEFLNNLSIDAKIAQWRQTVSHPQVFKRVARDAGRIVGFVSCGPAREGAAKEADGEIFAIYILKAFHGRKIGRSQIAAASRFWLSKGGRNLMVLSMAGNKQAIAFYEALGGVQVYEGSFEIAGTRMVDKGHIFNNLAELAAPA